MSLFALLPTVIALIGTAIAVTAGFRSIRRSLSRSPGTIDSAPTDAVSSALIRGARLRMVSAIIVTVVVAFVVASLPIDGLATAVAIAPGLAVTAGLSVIAITPLARRVRNEPVRRAELAPRRARTFGPRWGFILPVVAASVLALMLVTTAAMASLDDFGLSRAISMTTENGSSRSGPFPGWFYATPLLVVSALLCVMTLVTVHRVTTTPARNTATSAPVELQVRSSLIQFSLLMSSAAVVFYLGAIASVAVSAVRNLSERRVLRPDYDPTTYPSVIPGRDDFATYYIQPQFAAASIEAIIGLLLICGATILFALAATVAWRGAPKKPTALGLNTRRGIPS